MHNPSATDQIWSMMETAKRMGRAISEADAIAIIDGAEEIHPKRWRADRLVKHLGLTYPQRTLLGITTIGACDFPKRLRSSVGIRTAWPRKRSAVRLECAPNLNLYPQPSHGGNWE